MTPVPATPGKPGGAARGDRGGKAALHILVLDEEFPHPLNTGKRLRTFHLLRALARRHRITYLAYGNEDSPAAAFLREQGMTPAAVPPPDRTQHGLGFYRRLFANLFSPLPYIVTSHFTRRFAEETRRRAASGEYDLLLCEWTPYAIFLRDLPGVRAVISAHNLEAAIWRRYEEHERNPLRRAYIALQRVKVERFERRAFSWASGATAVTEAEARAIAALGVPYPVEVVENGVDLETFRPQETAILPHRLVFTGSMDWRPNQDAVLFFIREVLPRIRREIPDASLAVVGRNPPKRIVDRDGRDGVIVTGTVDNVRPFLAEAALCVVPLRIGGGSRLKILEALAMEKAVLSTTVGAEGLRLTPGRHLEIRDSAADLAEAAVALLRDPGRCVELGKAGRQRVEAEYGWDRIASRLDAYLERVARGEARG